MEKNDVKKKMRDIRVLACTCLILAALGTAAGAYGFRKYLGVASLDEILGMGIGMEDAASVQEAFQYARLRNAGEIMCGIGVVIAIALNIAIINNDDGRLPRFFWVFVCAAGISVALSINTVMHTPMAETAENAQNWLGQDKASRRYGLFWFWFSAVYMAFMAGISLLWGCLSLKVYKEREAAAENCQQGGKE